MTDILERLIIKYPTESWNWAALTINPSISIKFIVDKSYLPWKFDMISYRTDIDQIWVKILIEKDIKLTSTFVELLCDNRQISRQLADDIYEIVRMRIPRIRISNLIFGCKPSMFKFREMNQELNEYSKIILRTGTLIDCKDIWKDINDTNILSNIARNPNINIENLDKCGFDIPSSILFNIYSQHYSTTLEHVLKFTKSQHYRYLSSSDYSSFWFQLTLNLSISLDDIIENLHLPWNLELLNERYDFSRSVSRVFSKHFYVKYKYFESPFNLKHNARNGYKIIESKIKQKDYKDDFFNSLSRSRFDYGLNKLYRDIELYRKNWKSLVISKLNESFPKVLTIVIFSFIIVPNFRFPELQKEIIEYEQYL